MLNLASYGKVWYAIAMQKKAYQAQPDFAERLSAAGLRQVEAARKADISVFTLAHIASTRQRASSATANRIARVYAEAAGIDQAEALSLLFVELAAPERSPRPRGANGKYTKAAEEPGDDQ